MPHPARIVITPGEPAGIGPDITLQLMMQDWPVELVVIADPHLMAARAKLLGRHLKIDTCDLSQAPVPHQAGLLKLFPLALSKPCHPGQLNSQHAAYVIDTLFLAADFCLSNKAQAVTTGPVHKGILNDAGFDFTGHTEFFAKAAHVEKTVMLFVTQHLKVALLTTHLPLSKVAPAITQESLISALTILKNDLVQKFHKRNPKILVCGLNPHAGEGGHLGEEEITIISPVIHSLRKNNWDIEGPFSADTLFVSEGLKQADAVLAMYHDQALPVVKYASFGQAVNVTLGLPFIRTSVDHGVALDKAGSHQADASSLIAACKLGIELASQNSHG